jgi:hypothetical protein
MKAGNNIYGIILILIFTVLVISLPLSCGGSGWGGDWDWVSWMSCPSAQKTSDGNLVWSQFSAVPVIAEPRPGDGVSVNFMVTNNPVTGAVGTNANIPYASNIRVFLSFDTIIGPEDYFIAEYTIPGIYANNSVFIVDSFKLPHPTSPPDFPGADQDSDVEILDVTGAPTGRFYKFRDLYFPTKMPDTAGIGGPNYNPSDPDRPEYIGPASIPYYIIAVLDAENCIIEEGGIEPKSRVDQHQTTYTDNIYVDTTPANRLSLWNPNLPNLQIRFIDRQPASDLPQQGGLVLTQWEVVNSGVGPVLAGQRFGVRVFYSENMNYDSWDANIVVRNPDTDPLAIGPDGVNREDASNDDNWVITGPIFGNTNKIINVSCRTPYNLYRQNVYSGWYSSLAAWAGTDEYADRQPPPLNVPGHNFTIYNPIPSNGSMSNVLIAQVDSTNTIKEAVELDNFSTSMGTLSIGYNNGGAYDFEAVELLANFQNNILDLQFKYNSSLPASSTQSIAWYLSENDTAQSSDFFMERFWYNLSTGTGITLQTSFAPPAYNPGPPPGAYYVIGVIDDIFKESELYEDNNFVVSTNTIDWQ